MARTARLRFGGAGNAVVAFLLHAARAASWLQRDRPANAARTWTAAHISSLFFTSYPLSAFLPAHAPPLLPTMPLPLYLYYLPRLGRDAVLYYLCVRSEGRMVGDLYIHRLLLPPRRMGLRFRFCRGNL